MFYGAGQAFHYYADRYGLKLDTTVMGQCSVGAPREYLRQLDQLRGRTRVWVVFTHDQSLGKESSIIIDYLDRIGERLDSVEVPGSSGRAIEAASGYLYDLSDPNRLTAASSSTFAIAPDNLPRPFWMNCNGGALMSESP